MTADAEQAFSWPLMHNNVQRQDLDALIDYLREEDPRLTHGPKVAEFEQLWADWVGTEHAVMVNSGSSANDLTLLAIRQLRGPGEVILSPLGWVSDVAAVIHAGMSPLFVDIDPVTLSISEDALLARLNEQTRAVILVHILGFDGLTKSILEATAASGVPLIEDVCESHGAMHEGRRCGSFGYASNFSFYYAHHLTTIEGGAICTNDAEFADIIRMMRSHGLVRESRSVEKRDARIAEFPDLNPEFIFDFPARNNRSTELNAVLGLAQLPRLDGNIERRRRNFARFMENIDSTKYRNWYDVEASSNYAFVLVLQDPDVEQRDLVEAALLRSGIEFRRGLSGGGSQVRQPYMKRLFPTLDPLKFPNTEHVHHFGWYIGNHPGIELEEVDRLVDLLNAI
jgi:CDP-6-deoxy-D-xylo-4-hexulose-3-dehydrase